MKHRDFMGLLGATLVSPPNVSSGQTPAPTAGTRRLRIVVVANTYTAACTLASPRAAAATGDFSDMSELSSLKSFVTAFAGHIAAEAARS